MTDESADDVDASSWEPYRSCPECGHEYLRVFVITENVVRGDGVGGIVEQEWQSEYDLLYAACDECEATLYDVAEESVSENALLREFAAGLSEGDS